MKSKHPISYLQVLVSAFLMGLSLINSTYAQTCKPSLLGIWKISNSAIERTFGGYYEFTEDGKVICYKGTEYGGRFVIEKIIGEGEYDYNSYKETLTMKNFEWYGWLSLGNNPSAPPDIYQMLNVQDGQFDVAKNDQTRDRYVRIMKFRYFLTLTARKGSPTGHIYGQWIKVDARSTQAKAYGFYPKGIGRMIFGLVSDETGKIVNEYTGSTMFTKATSFRMEITAREYENTLGVVNSWSKQSIYDLVNQNCISFVADVASKMNNCQRKLTVPRPERFQFPDDYLKALRAANPNVEEVMSLY